MSKILLSIKPEYVERILKQEKLYEFRKKLPTQPVDTILIYCTYPIMKVVASVKVIDCIQGSPTAVWVQTKHAAGISRARYREYFRGTKTAYAFVLGKVSKFDVPISIDHYGIKSAPQSFVYIQDSNNIED